MLHACSHPNIIRLHYLVEDADHKIEAILLDYIKNARQLSGVDSLLTDQCGHWTQEIWESITYLHFNNFIWGDTEPGNILVRENDSLVLIDFGGGYTTGWVDARNARTIQGYERIVEFLKARVLVDTV